MNDSQGSYGRITLRGKGSSTTGIAWRNLAQEPSPFQEFNHNGREPATKNPEGASETSIMAVHRGMNRTQARAVNQIPLTQRTRATTDG